MKSRIRGGVAAKAAAAMAERRPVSLLATDVVDPHLPVLVEGHRKRPPQVRKPSSRHDVIHASTGNIETHKAELREAFGGTLSDQFVEVMMGKLISGLRPNPFDVLEEATLNAAIAVIASIKATSELEALLATQSTVAAFSAFRMLELSQRHLGEENIAVYGTFAVKLIRLQNEMIETINRNRRGNSQSIEVKHVHFHPGAQGVVGTVNHDGGRKRGGDQK